MEYQFNEDFSNIKMQASTGYQLLLTSSLYGTNFAIFGKFTFESEDKNGYIEVKKLQLKIYNYKGILDLGLSTLHKTQVSIKKNGNDDYVSIRFFLRACVSNYREGTAEAAPLTTYRDVLKKVDFVDEIKIKHPFFLKAERELIPISGDINKGPITNGVFDTEFYYRDGAHYVHRKVTGIPQAHQAGLQIKPVDEGLFDEAGPGKTCYEAAFHMVFK